MLKTNKMGKEYVIPIFTHNKDEDEKDEKDIVYSAARWVWWSNCVRQPILEWYLGVV